ncbi:pre-toxin TG domain-containing protein [Lactiplantibacillus daoliensis]|uniref:Pre-toxin TG domain-containing protein n=1 Tax=Lactiplantibacillus daoliensis TaxID=2559916 RepID=A0ABW1UGX4_9LACO|nr:pre-toxin TG domain-containing protein [Lactiplantibacillus daoliensis]
MTKHRPAIKKKKSSGSALMSTISRKTGISKSLISMVGDFVGYNDLYTMFTGKDATTGKKRSRWLGAAWTAFNFIPISKAARVAKIAKLLVTARKTEKVSKDIRVGHLATKAVTKRTGETAAKKAAQKRAEQLVKQRKKAKPVKAKKTKTLGRRVMSKKAYKQKYGKKVTKKQKKFNKKKQAKRDRKQAYARSKSRTKKKVAVKKPQLVTNALLQQLKAKGVKYSAKDVLMVTKNSDGKLMWLEKGSSRAGLKHIQQRHAREFKERGIAQKDIPRALDRAIKSKPIKSGASKVGPYSEYRVDGKNIG